MKKNFSKSKFIFAALIFLITAIIVFSFAGCKNNEVTNASQNLSSTSTSQISAISNTSQTTETTVAQETTTSTTKQIPIEVTDGFGNKIILDKPAQKLIVFSPSDLEILAGLNAMDKVVEVDSWSVQNNEPLAKGFKGAGDANGINFETVTKLNPDLIIGINMTGNDDYKKLNDLGFKVYLSNTTSLEGTYNEIENIGKIIGKEEEGKKLSDDLKLQVDEIYNKVKDIPNDKKPKVFYLVWNDPIMSAGKNTFINDLIEKAGGINIVAMDGLSDWPEYSIEKLIKNNPDIIIAPYSLAATPDKILKDKKFSTIKAVKDKKVFSIPDNPISRPNQNVIKGLKMLSMAIHPEIFGEFKVIE